MGKTSVLSPAVRGPSPGPPSLSGLTRGRPFGGCADQELFLFEDTATGATRLVKLGSAGDFDQEARALAAVDEVGGTVRLVDCRQASDGRAALVTEFPEGPTFEQVIAAGPVPWRPAGGIALDLAKTLGAVHARGLVHGGVRPANLVLGHQGPVVIGFAAAVASGSRYRAASRQVGWAPVECAEAEVTATPAVDVHGLAAVLRALVARRPPGPASPASAPEGRRRAGPDSDSLPEALSELLAIALGPRPEGRYLTMGEFSAALAVVMTGGSVVAAHQSEPWSGGVMAGAARPVADAPPNQPHPSGSGPQTMPPSPPPPLPPPSRTAVPPPSRTAVPPPAEEPAPPSAGEPVPPLPILALPPPPAPGPAPPPAREPVQPTTSELALPLPVLREPAPPAPPPNEPGSSALGRVRPMPRRRRARAGGSPRAARTASSTRSAAGDGRRGAGQRRRTTTPRPAGIGPGRAERGCARPPGSIALGAAAALVTAVAMAMWWFGRSDIPPAGAALGTPGVQIVEPDPPLPGLEGGTVTVDSLGDPYFAWTNPSPRQGDQYLWWLLAAPDQIRTTGQDQVSVPRGAFGAGPVCIEVRLVRGEKTSGQPLRVCEGR